jgi:hypothetical protein
MTPTIGSHALLLQMATNLVHNAVVHNLPGQGTVWVTTGAHPKGVVLTVENTGESLPHNSPQRLSSRFSAAPNAYAPSTQVSASAWQSSRASPKHTTEPSPSPPGPLGGSALRCNYPPRHRTLAGDDQGNCRIGPRGIVKAVDHRVMRRECHRLLIRRVVRRGRRSRKASNIQRRSAADREICSHFSG